MSPFSVWDQFNLIIEVTQDVTPDEVLARIFGNNPLHDE